MTPIERAARALCKAQSGCDDYDAMDEAFQDNLKDHVRAVLEAVKEPSEGMSAAAREVPCDAESPGGVVYSSSAESRAVYQAMIDAALTE